MIWLKKKKCQDIFTVNHPALSTGLLKGQIRNKAKSPSKEHLVCRSQGTPWRKHCPPSINAYTLRNLLPL